MTWTKILKLRGAFPPSKAFLPWKNKELATMSIAGVKNLSTLTVERITSNGTSFESPASGNKHLNDDKSHDKKSSPPQNIVITTIGIKNPEKRNCVDLETARELEIAFSTFERDQSSQVAVLFGHGGHFSAGLNLKEVSKFSTEVNFQKSENYNPVNVHGIGPMGPSRRIFKKPVIAAVSGYAVAGGMEIALMCDVRIVEESAIFGIFCRRFGVPLIDGGTIRLPALIGLSRALDLILTGRPVASKEALQIGLANKVVPDGESLMEAIKFAEKIARFPQACMNTDRLSAYNAQFSSQSFQDAVEQEMLEGLNVIHKESVKGATSFVQGKGRHGKFDK